MNLLEEFQDRASVLNNAHFNDVTGRLLDLLRWLEQEAVTKQILDELKRTTNINAIFNRSNDRQRPQTNTREEIAAVGLHLIEMCRDEKVLFYSLCFHFHISPPYQTSMVQDHSDAGMKDYVVPFLAYVEKELVRAAEAHSVVSAVEGRFSELLTAEIRKLLPKTSSSLERISGDFLRPEGDVMWQNIGNSCRQTLIEFSAELREICGIELPAETKESDVKAILKHVLGKTCSPGRFKETLEALSEGVWNHTQSLLHRPATNKKEAVRVFLWTGMVVSEFAQVVRAYNEG
jgi:hypothetical protein